MSVRKALPCGLVLLPTAPHAVLDAGRPRLAILQCGLMRLMLLACWLARPVTRVQWPWHPENGKKQNYVVTQEAVSFT